MSGAALREVELHGVDVVPCCSAVAPKVGAVRLTMAQAGRLEHRHRRPVGMQDAAAKKIGPHGLDERRELRTDGTNPLWLDRSRYRKAWTAQDCFLTVQRLVETYLAATTCASRPAVAKSLSITLARTGA